MVAVRLLLSEQLLAHVAVQAALQHHLEHRLLLCEPHIFLQIPQSALEFIAIALAVFVVFLEAAQPVFHVPFVRVLREGLFPVGLGPCRQIPVCVIPVGPPRRTLAAFGLPFPFAHQLVAVVRDLVAVGRFRVLRHHAVSLRVVGIAHTLCRGTPHHLVIIPRQLVDHVVAVVVDLTHPIPFLLYHLRHVARRVIPVALLEIQSVFHPRRLTLNRIRLLRTQHQRTLRRHAQHPVVVCIVGICVFDLLSREAVARHLAAGCVHDIAHHRRHRAVDLVAHARDAAHAVVAVLLPTPTETVTSFQ